jgi:nucleoredoxin
VQAELSKKFKVQGIPTLVFVDGKSGSLITADGRSIITDDLEGAGFPWKPQPFSEMISSGKFVNKDKGETTWEELKGKTIGLYFSAHWVRSEKIVSQFFYSFGQNGCIVKINFMSGN